MIKLLTRNMDGSGAEVPIRVGYIFAGSRSKHLDSVIRGENHGGGLWGLTGLNDLGIRTELIEPELVYPAYFCRFLRRKLSSYWVPVSVFWRFFAYDLIFTSTAFGAQFLFTLIGFSSRRWVMHDFNITGFIGKEKILRQKLFAFMVARSAGIVTLSFKEAEMLRDRFPHLARKIVCIPFGVDKDFFIPEENEEKQQILAVGMDPDRDYRLLFKACEGLGVPLVVTTDQSRLVSLAPLPSFVIAQRFSPRELVEKYNRSMIVALPLNTSRRLNDAMGCSSLFEAMMMGKAIVATRTFTTESYITDRENGILVEEGDEEGFRNAIQELLTNEDLRGRLGERARAFALENLDIERCAKKLADFFERVAGHTQ